MLTPLLLSVASFIPHATPLPNNESDATNPQRSVPQRQAGDVFFYTWDSEIESTSRPTLRSGGRLEGEILRRDQSGTCPAPIIGSSRPLRFNDITRQQQGINQRLTLGLFEDEATNALRQSTDFGQPTLDSIPAYAFLDLTQRSSIRMVMVDEQIRPDNEQGRVFYHGANMFLSNRAVMRDNSWMLTIEPELHLAYDDTPYHNAEQQHGRLRLNEGTIQYEAIGLRLSAGVQQIVWGPGRHGHLIIGNDVAPLPMVHLSSSEPMTLPGELLSKLGYFQPEFFLGWMDDERRNEDQLIMGTRLGWRVSRYFELGFNRVAVFGGKHGKEDFTTVRDMLFVQGENGPDDPSDQKAGFDWRIIGPEHLPFEAYGEIAGEDEAGMLPGKNSFIAGLVLPRLKAIGLPEWSLTLEHAELTYAWYKKGADQYRYRDNIIGHHVDSVSSDFFAEMRGRYPDLELFVSYDYEEHGKDRDVSEFLQQVRIGANLPLKSGWEMEVVAGMDFWENERHIKGHKEQGSFFSMTFSRGW